MRLLVVLFFIFFIGATNVFAQEESVELEQEESNDSSELGGIISEILADKKEEVEPVIDTRLWKLGSIMYKTKNMELIGKAMQAHKQGVHISTLLPDIFPPDGRPTVDWDTGEKINPRTSDLPVVNKPAVAPVFYLSSILYIEPDNWSVWVNGEKISFGEEHDEFEIVKVNDTHVSLVWRETMIDYIFPEWSNHFEPMNDKRFVSNNKNIVIDVETGDVSFVLGVNQTLDTSVMQVVEGEMRPKDLASTNTVDGVGQDGESGFDDDFPDDINLPNDIEGYNNRSPNKSNDHMDNYMKQLNGLRSILGK